VGQKILVVEDNELNLKLFCDLLGAHGYEAEAVRDGREAVERARAFAPDLIVMDIQMPHISGLELIEQIKVDDGLKQIPIMAVTAYAARGDEERIRDAGAEGYVSKPISVLRFVEAVAGLLTAAAARAEPAPGDPAEDPIEDVLAEPATPDASASEMDYPSSQEGESHDLAEEAIPPEGEEDLRGSDDEGAAGSD
jgi:two-component system cell cycle response regulator DivK